MTNLYETLGVSQDASDSDIKKAYRSLSLKYHPDREGGDTQKFQEISSAYEVLSDPAKKGQYDMEKNGFPGGGGGGMHFSHGGDEFADINHMFNMMFNGGGMPGFGGGMPGFGGPSNVRIFHNGVQVNDMGGGGGGNFFQNLNRPPPIMKNVKISIEQAFQGVSIPLEIERWILIQNVKHNETETIYITIPPGIDENEMLILQHRGHVLNDAVKGDIKVAIQIENNTPFRRMGLDIIYKRNITLKESLCGFSFELMHLNGKQLCLNNTIQKTIIRPNSKKVIPNMGFIREGNVGNLIIEFDVEYPEALTESQMESLINIL